MIIGIELVAMGLLAALQVEASQKHEAPYILGSVVEHRTTEPADPSLSDPTQQHSGHGEDTTKTVEETDRE